MRLVLTGARLADGVREGVVDGASITVADGRIVADHRERSAGVD